LAGQSAFTAHYKKGVISLQLIRELYVFRPHIHAAQERSNAARYQPIQFSLGFAADASSFRLESTQEQSRQSCHFHGCYTANSTVLYSIRPRLELIAENETTNRRKTFLGFSASVFYCTTYQDNLISV